jgi:hypothetical protein
MRALSEIDRAIGSGDSSAREQRADTISHDVLTVRLQRILWKRLIGLSLFILRHDTTRRAGLTWPTSHASWLARSSRHGQIGIRDEHQEHPREAGNRGDTNVVVR